MIQAFYKTKPKQDTPYRQLSLLHQGDWLVRVSAGSKWGRENSEELRSIREQTFEAAQEEFDIQYRELEKQGWIAYSPMTQW